MKRECLSRVLPALVAAACWPLQLIAVTQVPIDAYRRAEVVRPENALPLALNLDVTPIWLPGGDRFWFREQSASGSRYIAVDPAHGRRTSAFDQRRLATAIAQASGKSVDAEHLDLTELTILDPTGKRVSFSVDKKLLTCDLTSMTCNAADMVSPDPALVMAPDGARAAFTRGADLWLRDMKTGAERQVTTDGTEHFAYGKWPDRALISVMQAATGRQFPPYGIQWSPDSRYLVVVRVDERRLPEYHFLQSVPRDGSERPKDITIRTVLSSEPDDSATEVSVVDATNGIVHKLATGKDGLSLPYLWSAHNDRFLAIQSGDFSRNVRLLAVDLASGRVTEVLHEESNTFLQVGPLSYDEPAIRYLADTDEVVWYSQRDGWNHLYLMDARTGRLKAKLGEGPWSVQNIVSVDERRRRLYFTAVGREHGQDPYLRHLYSVRLDGSELRLLTPEVADHVFPGITNPAIREEFKALGRHISTPELFSPSGKYFIDTRSTVGDPPVSVVRSADGRLVMPLVKADVTALVKTGWSAPEPFLVKAADGKTDLAGIIIKPPGFSPERRYAVVEDIYNGPQTVTTPHDFASAITGQVSSRAQSFAQLGFVAVVMDGRGTPMRSKAFQDYMYGHMQDFALDDHVAVLKELAAQDPYLDLTRLGVIGHSFGGYAAMKAILGYPDFYKVAVASAGPYDMYGLYPLDAFFPPPEFPAGAAQPGSVSRRPTNWGDVDLTQDAERLRGKLLIGYSDTDENVYPAVTVRMVNALVKANKEFDLVFIPNRTHAFSNDPYFLRRTWDFFVRNLLDAEPPKDYAFGGYKR